MRLHGLERIGELVDRVVGAWLRAVATRVEGAHLVAGVGLLGGLNVVGQRLAVLVERAAARVGVERIFGVHPAAVLVDELAGGGAGRLFIAGQHHHEIARRHEAFLLQAREQRHQRGDAVLHIEGATAVEEAVRLLELERIALPVFFERWDYIEMREQEDRLARGCTHRRLAAVAHDQIGRLVQASEQHVLLSEACRAELACEVVDQLRCLVAGRDALKGDDSLEDLARLRLQRRQRGRGCRRRRRRGSARRQQECRCQQRGNDAPATTLTSGGAHRACCRQGPGGRRDRASCPCPRGCPVDPRRRCRPRRGPPHAKPALARANWR